MILEHADIRIDPAHRAAFETAIQHGIESVLRRATGFSSARVVRCIETPGRYILMIDWQTLENHTVDFRTGPLYAEWRAIVGPFFSQPPVVEHFEQSATLARAG